MRTSWGEGRTYGESLVLSRVCQIDKSGERAQQSLHVGTQGHLVVSSWVFSTLDKQCCSHFSCTASNTPCQAHAPPFSSPETAVNAPTFQDSRTGLSVLTQDGVEKQNCLSSPLRSAPQTSRLVGGSFGSLNRRKITLLGDVKH